ncbi:lipid metabolism-related [Moniliophthora roreri MCA 2997]|uniref:Lipid metabolism-related n=1 Tax=Moniliophthora roreri (strain MCA 2997) TaxID=1381753 RepID=V2X680_MONRO|nr:lipid metabolism-related [Moniliophthora roreri MCA 2997]
MNRCCGHRKGQELTTVHFSSKPVLLSVSSTRNERNEERSLKELVKSRCPTLFTAFETSWWLASGHTQTLYSVFADFSLTDRVWYRRQFLRLADGGTLALDFAPIDHTQFNDETPIIVVQHGLSGGSYEPYLKAIVSRVIAPKGHGGLGYRVVVVHHRGCGGSQITSPKFYTAGTTEDVLQVLIYLSHKYPRAPLHGLGFSLGANMMTRYVAFEGKNSRLRSAAVLANPWDLAANSDRLESTYIGKYIYGRALGGNLVALIKRHHKVLALDHPALPIALAVSRLLSVPSPTLTQYDEYFTRFIGGPAEEGYPFPSVNAFYNHTSSHHLVKDIRVPFLAINAADDPVVQHVPMMDDDDAQDNPFVVMALTAGGGHLGWFKDSSGERWTTKPVLEWLRMVVEDVIHDSKTELPRLYVDDEGFVREEGRPLLGCKECDGGGLIDANGGESGVLQGL